MATAEAGAAIDAGSRADDVEAEAHRGTDVGRVERDESNRVGKSLRRSEVDRVTETNRL